MFQRGEKIVVEISNFRELNVEIFMGKGELVRE